jgi:integrase
MEKESKAYRAWKDTYLGSPKVWARYEQFLDRFLEYNKIESAETLWEMRKADLKSDDSRDTKRIEGMIKAYWRVLTTEGTYYLLKTGTKKQVVLKPQTANHFVKAMVSFFKAQGQPLNLSLKEFKTEEGTGRDIASKEEIKLAYSEYFGNNKERNRALIMLAKESGLRCSDIVALNVENYSEASVIENDGGETFRVFKPTLTQKNKVNALIHLGSEACAAVDEYLRVRGVVKPQDALFLDDEGKRMRSVTLTMQFDRMFAKMGSKKSLGGHSLRKFYITSLEGAGLSDNWIKKMCGKKLSRSDASYVKPEDLGLLTPAYVKGYESLRVFSENKQIDKDALKAELKSEVRAEWQSEMRGIMEEAARTMTVKDSEGRVLQEPQEEEAEDEVVEVKQSELSALMKRLEALEKKQKK